ncbi:hypothetical protein M2315_004274 [Agrobacterium fabrum]|nr:hypothetical protein [Agrobacterium fabrum]MDH6297784.1 hypothetical protein [Agrobacterium fabrum]
MCALRHGLRHKEMIEGITVMKRKSCESDKMRVRDIQPIETLIRQDRKNLFYIGIEFANPQLHGDFPKGDSTDSQDRRKGYAHGFPASRHRSTTTTRRAYRAEALRLVFHRSQDVRRQAVEVFGNFDLAAQRAGFASHNVL